MVIDVSAKLGHLSPQRTTYSNTLVTTPPTLGQLTYHNDESLTCVYQRRTMATMNHRNGESLIIRILRWLIKGAYSTTLSFVTTHYF